MNAKKWKRLVAVVLSAGILCTVTLPTFAADSINATKGNATSSSCIKLPQGFTTDTWKELQLINRVRHNEGQEDPLSAYTKLNAAAQTRAQESDTQFSHVRPNGTSCFTIFKQYGISAYSVGENLAQRFTDAGSVVQAWMESTGHRANILNANYAFIGMGEYTKNSVTSWSQLFTTASSRPTGLSVENPPKEILAGRRLFDIGTVLRLQYGSTTTYLPLDDCMCSGLNTRRTGTQNITVNVRGVTTTFSINVISPNGISLTEDSVYLHPGATTTLKATKNSNGSQVTEAIAWTSSNPSAVTVENGVVHSVGNGSAEITAKTATGSDTCTVSTISVKSDTTMDFSIRKNSTYTYRFEVIAPRGTQPNITTGNGSVLRTEGCMKRVENGHDVYYVKVRAIGKVGEETGVYTTLPGQQAVRHCKIRIAA